MRNSFFLSILFFFLFASSGSVFGQCKIAQLISDNKAKILPPYKYDGFTYFNFEFTDSEKSIKREFIAFKGQKYRLLFCASEFEEHVPIQIIDTKDNALIAGTSIGESVNIWEFEPPRTGTYTIVYSLPPSTSGITHEACIAMLIGYQGK